MGKTTFIYALCEPGTRTIRYIGKANDPAFRFKQHLRQSVQAKTHLGNWLRSLLGEKPNLIVLREVPDEHREIAEERYIRLARGLGMKLVNGTDGGDGCYNPTPETRAKMGGGNRGKKGKNHPAFGLTRSPETRAAIAEGQSGEKNHQFGKCGPLSSTYGYVHTSESRALMSAAKKGKCPSDAALAAASAATKGVPKSAEHNAKNSAAQKRVWAARKAAQV